MSRALTVDRTECDCPSPPHSRKRRSGGVSIKTREMYELPEKVPEDKSVSLRPLVAETPNDVETPPEAPRSPPPPALVPSGERKHWDFIFRHNMKCFCSLQTTNPVSFSPLTSTLPRPPSVLDRLKPISVISFRDHVQTMHIERDKPFEAEYEVRSRDDRLSSGWY